MRSAFFQPFFLACFASAFLFPSCDKDENDGTGNSIGSYRVDGKRLRVNSARLDTQHIDQGDSTKTMTTLRLNGADGSRITLEFMGENKGLRSPLSTSLPRALFRNKSGLDHESINGNLDITRYDAEGNSIAVSGEFEFTAQNLNESGELRISNGNFDHREE